jgi:hypothetical protein
MKTEPTEALKLIEYSWYALPNATAIDRKDCVEAVNIAFKEGQSNPKIKQLEWDGKEELAFFTAKTNIGKYMIDSPRRDGIFMLMYTPDWSYESFILHASNSIDKLKSIAQQDFEACVKGCLITE